MLGRVLALLLTWGAALVVLFWGRLPFRWRRLFALFTSAAGIVFLVLALNTEGLRESPTVGYFLLGTPYPAGKASAAASLPYYVATGVLLLLGFVGLAAGDAFVLALARRPFLNAVGLSWAVTALRLVLEKAAAPAAWTHMVGITWLAPVVGAYFAVVLRSAGRGFQALLRHLLGYAFAVRGAVAALMIVASSLKLGTHYDISQLTDVGSLGRLYAFEAGSLGGMLAITFVSQLVFWPVYTVLSGLVGAGIARVLMGAYRGDKLQPARPPLEPTAEDPRV
jgi:hypothetical protein